MGLSAASARIFLLTKENNSYELQAQDISEERMVLAKEQEQIANEYSDATSNMIFQSRVTTESTTEQRTMTLGNLALSQSGNVQGTTGSLVAIADGSGTMVAAARLGSDGNVEYFKNEGGSLVATSATDSLISKLDRNGFGTPLQNGVENGAFKIFVQDTSDTANTEATTDRKVKVGGKETFFVQKDVDSLSGSSSRYYTEDDAAAQAKYQTEMTRVTALDTKLENKLNHVETQKKSVEKELESAESVKSSNVDRTFSYFGN